MSLHADFKTREQAAYEALRQGIVQGGWSDNEPLVVSRLAPDLGVSRITVSNALKRLSGEGFVRLIPHKGAVVAAIEPDEIRQIYLMRAELEGLSARESVTHVTERDIQALVAFNEELGTMLRVDEPDTWAMRAVDVRFHQRLRDVPQMPLLAETLQNLADQCEAYRARVLDAHQISLLDPARHLPLLEALEQRDADRAASAMRRHIREGQEMIFSMLKVR